MRAAIWTTALAAILATGAAQADVVIARQATKHMDCEAGVCSPTAHNAVLNSIDLVNMLASGDVKVATGNGATNIVIKDAVSWTSTSRLTLDANQSVEIGRPVMVTGTGAITITTNDGATGGDLILGDNGNVTFWDLSSSLVINGNSYTLVGDIATLAAGITNNPSGFCALAKDYDASVDGTYSMSPVYTEFSGTFEGLGHAISNLTISTSNEFSTGLFRRVSGVLRDVGVLKVKIQGSSGDLAAGGLLGFSDKAAIVGSHATGTIKMGDVSAAGGLVGLSSSTSDGTITRSHAAVSIVVGNGSGAGGLVGSSGFFIFHSYASGRIRVGNDSYAGGLVGLGSGGISESYATGNVIAGSGSHIGGLVGDNSVPLGNSYATGAVKGGDNSKIGGLVGTLNGNKVIGAYAIGLVKGTSSGGFSGDRFLANGSNYNYWDTDTSSRGRKRGCGGGKCGQAAKGLTTEELQAGLPEGFDPAIWGQSAVINNGYPYLLNNPPR